jgi:hypothetical protein
VEVHGTAYAWIAPNVWPQELRWVQENLGIRSGSPRFILVEGRKILIHRFGTAAWTQSVLPMIERWVAARTSEETE